MRPAMCVGSYTVPSLLVVFAMLHPLFLRQILALVHVLKIFALLRMYSQFIELQTELVTMSHVKSICYSSPSHIIPTMSSSLPFRILR